jgi:hypothetical protein
MAIPAARDPGPLVTLVRNRAVAKVDSTWMSAVLARHFPGVDVEEVKVMGASYGSACHAMLAISYRSTVMLPGGHRSRPC